MIDMMGVAEYRPYKTKLMTFLHILYVDDVKVVGLLWHFLGFYDESVAMYQIFLLIG